jgi:hypothetical protein
MRKLRLKGGTLQFDGQAYTPGAEFAPGDLPVETVQLLLLQGQAEWVTVPDPEPAQPVETTDKPRGGGAPLNPAMTMERKARGGRRGRGA